MNLQSSLIALAFCAIARVAAGAEESATSLNNGPWKLAPQSDVKQTGEQLATPGFADEKWVTAQVPGTALVDYITAGLTVQDPNFGTNIGRADRKKFDQNFWYRTEFTVPADYCQAGRVWLNLDGVHRDADVYVNGTKVGTMLGFFQRGRFDVTKLVHNGKKNSLAVLAHLMVVPTDKEADGKLHGNCSSPSLLCSRGWDWMPRVPGLNTGILKDVYLTHTGEVSLVDPWIRTALPTPAAAELTIQTELANSSGAPVSGELVAEINPGKISFTKPITVKPGETRAITMTAVDTPALRITKPRLWWPNGYGDPNLYTCKLEFRTGNQISDRKNVTFGIKQYSYEVKENILYFCINGTRLFLKGGSWGLPEYLMRNRTAADYDIRVRLHKEQNFNIIRNWMGSVPDEAFYQACDKYGIMVWDEFWLDSQGCNPSDIGVFHANAIEKVKQFRNHPSISFWVAMNEGTPPPEVSDPLAAIIKKYDGDDRQYHAPSNSNFLSGSGPWQNYGLKDYFNNTLGRRRVDSLGKTVLGLRSEVGIPTFTSFDSFKKFMPKETWWPANATTSSMWGSHYFGRTAVHANPERYATDLASRYGMAADAEDFCRKSQLLNLESMKAIFEGWLDRSDRDASGAIIWMSHPAYPVFVWQTYDYYYDTTGSYWGAKTGCEPVHIFWNCNDDRIRISNTSGRTVENLRADLWIYNMDGTEKAHQTAQLKAPCDAVADPFKLATPTDLSPTHFLKLRLTDAAGKIVSQNFYWRGTEYLDFFGLSSLKLVKLAVTDPQSEVLTNGMTRMTMDITNPANSGTVAFAIRPKPVKPSTGEQILPVFMNDGYFALTPGETKHLTIEYHAANAGGEKPQVVVECWNNFPHPTPTKPPPPPITAPDPRRKAPANNPPAAK